MKIAINIETSKWRNIVHHLYANGWQVIEKYIGYDASIDVDFIVLRKNKETIYCGWDNLDQGEIRCSESQFLILTKLTGIAFEYGEPKTLNFKNLAIIRLLSYPSRLSFNKDKLMEDFFYYKSNSQI